MLDFFGFELVKTLLKFGVYVVLALLLVSWVKGLLPGHESSVSAPVTSSQAPVPSESDGSPSDTRIGFSHLDGPHFDSINAYGQRKGVLPPDDGVPDAGQPQGRGEENLPPDNGNE